MNSSATTFENEIVPSKDQILLSCGIMILISFQVLDAILTLEGVERFGLHAEGNIIIRHLIEWLTPFYAMCVVKGLAISLCFVLYRAAHHVPWITSMVYALNALYFSVAIIPWYNILYA